MADAHTPFAKPVIGTSAPPPAQSTNLSYKLNISKNDPTTTNIVVICPGVSLVLSSIICPIKHTKPQNKKGKEVYKFNKDKGYFE